MNFTHSPQPPAAINAVAYWCRHRRHKQQFVQLLGYVSVGKSTITCNAFDALVRELSSF